MASVFPMLSIRKTGRPIEHNLVSVTVIAPTALEADGWDTGLMVLGPEKAKEVVRREGLAVYMIMKEGEGLNPDVAAVQKLSGQRKKLKSKIAGFVSGYGDTLRLSAMLNKGVRNEKSFTHH